MQIWMQSSEDFTDNLKCQNEQVPFMDASCGNCGNTFRAEDTETTFCSECSSQQTPEPEAYSAPIQIDIGGSQEDCMTFNEMEEKLFGSIEGSKTVARTLTRLRLEGYNEEAWKVVLGLTAYAYKNLNCNSYSSEAMLKFLNQRPLREVVEFIPANVEELTDSVMNAEIVKDSEGRESPINTKDALMMGGLSLLALTFALATRQR